MNTGNFMVVNIKTVSPVMLRAPALEPGEEPDLEVRDPWG